MYKLQNQSIKRLSEALGATEVTVYDTMNVGHLLSLVDAQNVITQIAAKYQMDFATKQARMVAVDRCLTIEELAVDRCLTIEELEVV